ncbi:hypothetical protein Ciccas_000369 [Cichlidogyrus casuarinus]|uniref:Uncharacterized protein n=1 Tax=Cichlidogyrus casuarinus TaxID=1844966 RepID=A0ABD2QN43_9PLAT
MCSSSSSPQMRTCIAQKRGTRCVEKKPAFLSVQLYFIKNSRLTLFADHDLLLVDSSIAFELRFRVPAHLVSFLIQDPSRNSHHIQVHVSDCENSYVLHLLTAMQPPDNVPPSPRAVSSEPENGEIIPGYLVLVMVLVFSLIIYLIIMIVFCFSRHQAKSSQCKRRLINALDEDTPSPDLCANLLLNASLLPASRKCLLLAYLAFRVFYSFLFTFSIGLSLMIGLQSSEISSVASGRLQRIYKTPLSSSLSPELANLHSQLLRGPISAEEISSLNPLLNLQMKTKELEQLTLQIMHRQANLASNDIDNCHLFQVKQPYTSRVSTTARLIRNRLEEIKSRWLELGQTALESSWLFQAQAVLNSSEDFLLARTVWPSLDHGINDKEKAILKLFNLLGLPAFEQILLTELFSTKG